MKTQMKLVLAAAAMTGLAIGCAHKEKTEVVEAPVVSQTEQAAAELDRNVVSNVSFVKGQRGVSLSAAEQIDKAIAEARKLGEIDVIDVAVWSDMEYPGKGRDLPSRQVDLASDRGSNIEKYIDKKAPSASVKVHNMAKQPSALARLVDTKDAKLKQQLAGMGIAPTEDEAVMGRASSALVFIKVK